MTLHAESLVSTDAERASLQALRDASGEEGGAMEGHCLRCFRLGERLAEHHGRELDREVLLCAAFLHDIGLYESVTDGGVYTEEGADLARKICADAGWDAKRAELCADACARHHALTSQWDYGVEVEVLRVADRVDISAGLSRGGLSRDSVKAIFAEVPRDGFYGGLLHTVWPVLKSRPLTMPKIFKP